MTPYQLFLRRLLAYPTLLISVGCSFNKRQQTQTEFWLAEKNAGMLSIVCSAAASWLTAMAAPEILVLIRERPRGSRTIRHLICDIRGTLEWKNVMADLQGSREHWMSASGCESLRHITHPDILSCVSVFRRATNATLWLEAKAGTGSLERVRQDMAHAFTEILAMVKG